MVLAGTGILLFHVLFYGPLLAAMAYGGGERVVAGKGQILLEVDNSFLDPVYDYYAYRGPIFRGAEPIYGNRHEPLDGEA